MQTTIEQLEKDRVKIRVEVPEDALDKALAQVYKRWAREIKVPGFRPGKIPRQIIDSRVGPEAIREEALRESLPDIYREALDAEDIEAITSPDIEVTQFEKGKPIVFEATVDVRPEVVVPDLSSIKVTAPAGGVTEADLQDQLTRLREGFAELETVSREARGGDFVLIDIKGYKGEEMVDSASAPDYLYELGSNTGPPELDREVVGNKPGSILKFNSTMPEGAGEMAGETISFSVLLKEVKAKKLPALDDDFAKTVGEFDSLDDLKAELHDRLEGARAQMAKDELRGLVLEALVDASDLDAPVKLVDQEFEHRLHHFEEDLSKAGMTMADYEAQVGSTELEIRADMRSSISRGIKAELLLEQVAREQNVDVTEEDIGRELAIAAARSGQDVQELAKQVVESGRLSSVAADIMRRKALDYVIESATIEGVNPDPIETDEEEDE
jgi:trigger factor